MNDHPLLAILPLASAILWLTIGVWPIAKRRLSSPFEKAMASFAILLGGWALADWVFLGITDAAVAVAISNVRISMITVAMFALLLGMKWIARGHSRYDPVLVAPVVGSLAIVWTGLTTGVEFAAWGPRLVRDPYRYGIWAAQQVAYGGVAIALALGLVLRRPNLPSRARRRMLITGGSLMVLLGLWLGTNLYDSVTETAGVPWFSSVLLIPGAAILAMIARLTPEGFGALIRAVADIEERVLAIYMFHRSGEPLVALSAGRSFPIEAERLQTILEAVGGFVEKTVDTERGYGVTGLRFDAQGAVAVRGQYVIAAALYDGPAYDAVRIELVRVVESLEERHWRRLRTWEEASAVAEEASEELSKLLPRDVAARPAPAVPSLADAPFDFPR